MQMGIVFFPSLMEQGGCQSTVVGSALSAGPCCFHMYSLLRASLAAAKMHVHMRGCNHVQTSLQDHVQQQVAYTFLMTHHAARHLEKQVAFVSVFAQIHYALPSPHSIMLPMWTFVILERLFSRRG